MDINWKEVGLVTVFGGLGGALSLVYSLTVGNPPAIQLPWGLLAYIFLGMGAGYLGVYVIAKTDTRQLTHCLGFAVACGLSWAPIMDATTALVENNKQRALHAKVNQLIEETRTVASELRNTSDEKLSVTTDSAIVTVTSLLDTSSKIDDLRLRVAAHKSVEEVIESLNEVSKRDFELASRARKDILYTLSSSGGWYGSHPSSMSVFARELLPFSVDASKAVGSRIIDEKDDDSQPSDENKKETGSN